MTVKNSLQSMSGKAMLTIAIFLAVSEPKSAEQAGVIH